MEFCNKQQVMKYIIILGDGMADYPIERLGGRTPLQAAHKPNIDSIAARGRCGLFATVEPDMQPGSEVANLAVMGYNAREVYQGRGVLEAASMGVAIGERDVGMRCNLICLADGKIKNHSAGHITSEESGEIIETLNRELGSETLRFYTGVSYRHLFVGEGLDPDLECAPPHDHPGEAAEGLMIRAMTPKAGPTAALLNGLTRKSWKILKDHPVNARRRAAGKDGSHVNLALVAGAPADDVDLRRAVWGDGGDHFGRGPDPGDRDLRRIGDPEGPRRDRFV